MQKTAELVWRCHYTTLYSGDEYNIVIWDVSRIRSIVMFM